MVYPGLVTLQPANPAPPSRRGQLNLLPQGQAPIDEGTSDHGAEAGDGEAAVHRQPGTTQVAPALGVVQNGVDGSP